MALEVVMNLLLGQLLIAGQCGLLSHFAEVVSNMVRPVTSTATSYAAAQMPVCVDLCVKEQ